MAAKEGMAGRWWIWVLLLIVTGIAGAFLKSGELFLHTVVEREVFENSYQRSEGLKSSIATDEAALAEIERMLRNSNIDVNTRSNLEQQAAAARIRIATTRSKQ